MFTFGVPLHGKSPYVKSLLLVEKKQDFVIREVWTFKSGRPCIIEGKYMNQLDKILKFRVVLSSGGLVCVCVIKSL